MMMFHPIHFAALLCVGALAAGTWLSAAMQSLIPFVLVVMFAFLAGPQLVGKFSDDTSGDDYQGTAAGFVKDE